MRQPLARQLASVGLLSAILFALLAWPAWAWGGAPGLAALGLAASICMVFAGLGRVAAVKYETLDGRAEAGPVAVQAGLAVRLLLTLAASLPVLLLEPVPRLPFAVWLGANYMAHLVLEVFVFLRDLRQNHGPSQGSGPSESSPEPAADLSDRPPRAPSPPGAEQE